MIRRSDRGSGPANQGGVMLLEALIALLIFSLGMLAIVAMQAAAVQASSGAKYRSEASLMANQLLGQMWVGDRTPATVQADFQGGAGTDGARYTTWLADVTATLPETTGFPPRVIVDPVTGLVTITVRWKLPSEPAANPEHSYTMVAQVR